MKQLHSDPHHWPKVALKPPPVTADVGDLDKLDQPDLRGDLDKLDQRRSRHSTSPGVVSDLSYWPGVPPAI